MALASTAFGGLCDKCKRCPKTVSCPAPCPVKCETKCPKPCPVKCETKCPKPCPVKYEMACPQPCKVKCETKCPKPVKYKCKTDACGVTTCKEKATLCNLFGLCARREKFTACPQPCPTACPVSYRTTTVKYQTTCPSSACPTSSGSLVGYSQMSSVRPSAMYGQPSGLSVPPAIQNAALSRHAGSIVDARQSGPDSWSLTVSTATGLRDLEVRNDGLILSDIQSYKDDTVQNLPATVRSSVNSAFPGAMILNVDEGATDGQPAFRIEMLQNGQQFFAIVAPNGQILNQGPLSPTGR